MSALVLLSCLFVFGCGSDDKPVAPEDDPTARLRDSCAEQWSACPPESIWSYQCDGFPVIGNMLQSDYEFVVDTVSDSLDVDERLVLVMDHRLSTRCLPAPEPECVVAVTTCTAEKNDDCVAGRYFWFELVDEELRLWQVGQWADAP